MLSRYCSGFTLVAQAYASIRLVAYQEAMLKCMREARVDHNIVGWYQSALMSSFYTKDMVGVVFTPAQLKMAIDLDCSGNHTGGNTVRTPKGVSQRCGDRLRPVQNDYGSPGFESVQTDSRLHGGVRSTEED